MQRVVITGVGVVSPFGAGVKSYWDGLLGGEQPISSLRRFDATGQRSQLAAEVPDEVLERHSSFVDGVHEGRLSRTDRFGLLAAEEAWTMADLGPIGSMPNAGLFFGSTTAGMFEGEKAFWDLTQKGPERARFKGFVRQPNGSPAETLARACRIEGPIEVVASACSASSMALEAALDALRAGETEVALTGGADGLCQTAFGGFNALRAVDPNPTRPFRAHRGGFTLGEGAAMLVLETEEHARARGAETLGFLVGSCSSCDAHHMTAPAPGGGGVVRAMKGALLDAGLTPDSIAFLNAHGSGTLQNDIAEAQALEKVFGRRVKALPVTSSKASVGHGLGTCGALEAVATLLCLQQAVVHPTPGEGPVDPDTPIDLVLGEPRALHNARYGMSLNLAFGGANAALIFERAEGENCRG